MSIKGPGNGNRENSGLHPITSKMRPQDDELEEITEEDIAKFFGQEVFSTREDVDFQRTGTQRYGSRPADPDDLRTKEIDLNKLEYVEIVEQLPFPQRKIDKREADEIELVYVTPKGEDGITTTTAMSMLKAVEDDDVDEPRVPGKEETEQLEIREKQAGKATTDTAMFYPENLEDSTGEAIQVPETGETDIVDTKTKMDDPTQHWIILCQQVPGILITAENGNCSEHDLKIMLDLIEISTTQNYGFPEIRETVHGIVEECNDIQKLKNLLRFLTKVQNKSLESHKLKLELDEGWSTTSADDLFKDIEKLEKKEKENSAKVERNLVVSLGLKDIRKKFGQLKEQEKAEKQRLEIINAIEDSLKKTKEEFPELTVISLDGLIKERDRIQELMEKNKDTDQGKFFENRLHEIHARIAELQDPEKNEIILEASEVLEIKTPPEKIHSKNKGKGFFRRHAKKIATAATLLTALGAISIASFFSKDDSENGKKEVINNPDKTDGETKIAQLIDDKKSNEDGEIVFDENDLITPDPIDTTTPDDQVTPDPIDDTTPDDPVTPDPIDDTTDDPVTPPPTTLADSIQIKNQRLFDIVEGLFVDWDVKTKKADNPGLKKFDRWDMVVLIAMFNQTENGRKSTLFTDKGENLDIPTLEWMFERYQKSDYRAEHDKIIGQYRKERPASSPSLVSEIDSAFNQIFDISDATDTFKHNQTENFKLDQLANLDDLGSGSSKAQDEDLGGIFDWGSQGINLDDLFTKKTTENVSSNPFKSPQVLDNNQSLFTRNKSADTLANLDDLTGGSKLDESLSIMDWDSLGIDIPKALQKDTRDKVMEECDDEWSALLEDFS